MNKEMQKLLKSINDKKNEVKSLVKDGKLDKAKAAKEELKELQEKFDLLFDLDEEEHEEIEDKVATGTAKTIGGKSGQEKPRESVRQYRQVWILKERTGRGRCQGV